MRVIITTETEGDITAIAEWIAKDSPLNALVVARRLRARIAALKQFPRSGRPAPERRHTRHELRQLSVRTHRIVYSILDDAVWVLHVRHSAQRFLRRSELRIDALP